MDNKEEIIEELEENTDNKVEDNIDEISDASDDKTEESNTEMDDEAILKEYSKKKKRNIIIVLSILLFIDLVALAIYVIGIDKVVSFIK